jgi:N6-L-threonylcarbamoyladenine synthase
MNNIKNNINILAIESSCDETAVAIYNSENGLLSHALYSQISLHQAYGGVVPELASRDHLEKITPLIQQSLADAKIKLNNIDIFAYTQGPGLAGALLVGASVANSMAFALNKPILGIHHLEGHILSPLLDTSNNLAFPFLCLLVSGGNTQLIWVQDVNEYEMLGETLDDSAGEAFDKTAKLLGMPYPGGPQVSQMANLGQDIYNFPRPMQHSNCLDFSFAGLKTAVLTQVKLMGGVENLTEIDKSNICASFVAATTDILSLKCMKAMKMIKENKSLSENKSLILVVAGGVSANSQLRDKLNASCAKNKYQVYYPPLKWCTDNAAMIALVADLKIKKNPNLLNNSNQNLNSGNFDVMPRMKL